MNERIKLTSSAPAATKAIVKKIIAACYPGWRGRKIYVCAATSYQMANFWDGGSRDYVVAFNPATGEAREPSRATTSPFNKQAHTEVAIPPGIVLVERTVFCGKDSGITLHVNPESAAALLPGLCITEAQKAEADRTIERIFAEDAALAAR